MPEPLFYFDNITNPTEFIVETGNTYNGSTFCIKERPEKGWTLDFVFNMSGHTMTTGNTFYYLGVKNEYNPEYYVDNNVSFDFTYDGKIRWRKSVYANCCEENSVVIEEYGKTPVLCTGGTSADFNVTITFERNSPYYGCALENEGGKNDLFTGWTITTDYSSLTGQTGSTYNDSEQIKMNMYINEENEIKTTILTLTDKWYESKYKRLGTLKIYLNGNLIYKNKEWEEVIPTVRTTGNTIVQVWGGGTLGSGGIHNGTCVFEIKRIAYYEVPLSTIEVRDNYLELSETYDINPCRNECD